MYLAIVRENFEIIKLLLTHPFIYISSDTKEWLNRKGSLYNDYPNITDCENLIKDYTPQQKQSYLNSQLQGKTQYFPLDKIDPNGNNEPLNEFIKWCVKSGANIHVRNAHYERPIDIAERQYKLYFSKNEIDNANRQKKIHHIFLSHTPHCSDAEIYAGLQKVGLIKDVANVIMNYYMPLTIDRRMAIGSPRNNNFFI